MERVWPQLEMFAAQMLGALARDHTPQ